MLQVAFGIVAPPSPESADGGEKIEVSKRQGRRLEKKSGKIAAHSGPEVRIRWVRRNWKELNFSIARKSPAAHGHLVAIGGRRWV